MFNSSLNVNYIYEDDKTIAQVNDLEIHLIEDSYSYFKLSQELNNRINAKYRNENCEYDEATQSSVVIFHLQEFFSDEAIETAKQEMQEQLN